ncbi:hypothetical protein ACFXJ8_12720 [Nonomuraea sp. NPDC059194]|uniref:hypothetical protein n=1 Tax=Nonomuraea sp. NPDC059194 TaxID=3346764 RepID=UPI0036996984
MRGSRATTRRGTSHAATGNDRRLTAAAVLALVLASGTTAAEAAMAKPPKDKVKSGLSYNHNETVLVRG